MPAAGAGRWLEVIGWLTLAGLLYGVGGFVFVAILKWTLLTRYRKCSVPMWTPFVWVSEAVTNLYEGIAVPNFMSYLRGTPWLPLAFNLLGAKIGRASRLPKESTKASRCASARICGRSRTIWARARFRSRTARLHWDSAESAVPIGGQKNKTAPTPQGRCCFFMSVPEPRGSRASLRRQEYARLS